jgi:hypothetical protein
MGSDMDANAVYIRDKVGAYFGSKWVAVVLSPDMYGAWAFWVYYDNYIFLENYERLNWNYIVWQSGL